MSVFEHILVLLLWVAVVLVVLVEVNVHAFHSVSSSSNSNLKFKIACNTRLSKLSPLSAVLEKKRYGLSGRYVKGTPSIEGNEGNEIEILSKPRPKAYKGYKGKAYLWTSFSDTVCLSVCHLIFTLT